MADEIALRKTYEARELYTRQLGAADPDFLAPMLNPSLMGGPMWPDLRQAWRVVRNGGNTIILSDGLSDPFSDEADPNVGFGIEVLGESSDSMSDQLQASWLMDLVYQISQQCAASG